MKLCVDCKHRVAYDHCRAPQNVEAPDPVTGKQYVRWMLCKSHREDGFIASLIMNTCGKRARWFEKAGAAPAHPGEGEKPCN